MSSGQRLVLTVCGGVILLVLGAVGVAAAVAYPAGSIEIAVQEKATEGASLSMKVPAILLHGALVLLPNVSIDLPEPALRDATPALLTAVRELERAPDAVFVDVVDGEETVSIAKRDGRLVIEVDASDASVRVAVPFDVLRRLLDKLETATDRPVGERV